MGEMHDQSDAQLLRAYAEHGAEAAFAEIVARHTDLVYSAALRQVYSPDLARDVTQSVFTDLARKAREVSFKLSPEASLVGWLYRGTRFAARDLNRTEIRRTQRERQAMEQVHSDSGTGVPPVWSEIAPHLEAALDELDDTDRDAVLLRYFKNHDLRTVGTTLGISDDAAQKRVSRAVERLREFFAKRGVSVGTSGLAVVISANAVQAAPVGLALTISTAAALTGTALATTATVTATKAIAMTAIQKTVITATIAVLAGVGIYETRQAAQLRDQVQTLQQQQTPLTEEIRQLQTEHDEAVRQLVALREDNERLNRNTGELLRLRGEVGLLRTTLADAEKRKYPAAEPPPTPMASAAWKLREPRKLGDFQNVGVDTPEAAAETVLWAAQNNASNLLEMISLPPELLAQARSEGLTDVLTRQLATQVIAKAQTTAKDALRQIWIDGGNKTTFTQNTKGGQTTYAGVISFHLSGRSDMDDPTTERHTDFLFANIDGGWRLVIPGLSPEISENQR